MGTELEFVSAASLPWSSVEQLLGKRGGREGCWCMRWRLPREQFEQQKGDANKRMLREGIEAERIHAILGLDNGVPVAWCSLGRREDYCVLATSDLLAPVDETPVWCIGCLYLANGYRRKGYSVGLLKAAIEYVQAEGGQVLEGYPLVPIKSRIPAGFAWTGFESAYRDVGFVEVERRNPLRPIVRYELINQLIK